MFFGGQCMETGGCFFGGGKSVGVSGGSFWGGSRREFLGFVFSEKNTKQKNTKHKKKIT